MSKTLNVEFHSLASASGVVDIAIRYNTVTGSYNFLIEENGLPTTLPKHVFNGILINLVNESCGGTIDGHHSDE
jgi:hypothetical protein